MKKVAVFLKNQFKIAPLIFELFIKKYSNLIIVLIIIWLLQALLFLTIYSQQNNTLARSGIWQSAKQKLEKKVYGSLEFMNEPQALAFDHLDLATWHGYQQLTTDLKQPFNEISFNFYLPEKSYLSFLFNFGNNQFNSVRLSAYPEFATAFLEIEDNGKFISKKILTPQILKSKTWHQAKIIYFEDSQTLMISVDKIKIFEDFWPIKNLNKIGFSGSFNGGSIDNIIVRNSKKDIFFQENFKIKDNWPWIYSMIFLIIIIILSLINIFFVSKIINKQLPEKLFGVVLTNANILLILILTEIYLVFFSLGKYPDLNSKLFKIYGKINKIEVFEKQNYITKRVLNIKKSINSEKTEKILIIGTSQTYGAGAAKVEDRFSDVAERLANKGQVQNKEVWRPDRYEFINAGLEAINSTDLLNIYEQDLIKFGHKILIINLSNNDQDAFIFEQNLIKFISLNQAKNIQTIFMLEPNSIEARNASPLHKTMKSVAGQYGIRLIDMETYLINQNDSGLIWWDEVHATSYGQFLIGNYIYENIKDLLYK